MLYLLNNTGEVTPTENFEFNKTSGLSVALGCFDGVHRGHRALIEHTIAKKELTPAVWTFSEPLTLPFINNVNDRISIFARHGTTLAICEDFQMVRMLTPEQFVKHMVEDFNVKHFVCGADFKYGINRTGDTETLKEDALKYGASTEIIPPLMTGKDKSSVLENQKISSTLIRKLLMGGQIESANSLLGRPFSVTDCVIHGKMLGRTLNVPTVNQKMEKGRVVLRYGVYDTVTVIDGKRYPSVTNFGVCPTVNGGMDDAICETHVIGENLDAYGKNITVEFYRFARDEKKFDSLQALKEAVELDIKRARNYFDFLSE